MNFERYHKIYSMCTRTLVKKYSDEVKIAIPLLSLTCFALLLLQDHWPASFRQLKPPCFFN